MSTHDHDNENHGGDDNEYKGSDGEASSLNAEKTQSKIVDLASFRRERVNKERRDSERTFIGELIEGYVETRGQNNKLNLLRLEFIELSRTGCSFRIPDKENYEKIKDKTELHLRMYFSPNSFLPLQVKVMSKVNVIDSSQRYVRFGVELNRKTVTFEAYRQFSTFIKRCALHLQHDGQKVGNQDGA